MAERVVLHDLLADVRRLLVIAPHPDDETLGCGGLIALSRQRDARVQTVFVTDGGASHPGSQSWPRERLAKQRKIEAGNALEILGAGNEPRLFMGLPDAAMPAPGAAEYRRALETLARLIGDFSPDLVLLPWRRDPHCDHQAAWRLTTEAISACRRAAATLEYAIWLDELGADGDKPLETEAGEIAVDIRPVLPLKRQAVAAHVSQTTALIDDDPSGFRLTPDTVARLTGPLEYYLRPIA